MENIISDIKEKYIYAETREELVIEIEKVAAKSFKEDTYRDSTKKVDFSKYEGSYTVDEAKQVADKMEKDILNKLNNK